MRRRLLEPQFGFRDGKVMPDGPPSLRSGQLESEHRPFVLCVIGGEVTSLGSREITGDGEPEARAPAPARPSARGPVETPEDAGEVIGGDARFGVRYDRLNRAVPHPSGQGHAASVGSVPQRVVQEDGKGLAGASNKRLVLVTREPTRVLGGWPSTIDSGILMSVEGGSNTREPQ